MATKWWTLLVVCLATFMLLLDVTIVNVALPDIQKELGSSFEDLQWVVDAYALALAALLLASGSLADLLGRRRVFVVGLIVFVTASLLCGLSGSPSETRTRPPAKSSVTALPVSSARTSTRPSSLPSCAALRVSASYRASASGEVVPSASSTGECGGTGPLWPGATGEC